MVQALEVSKRGLQLRMSQLGLICEGRGHSFPPSGMSQIDESKKTSAYARAGVDIDAQEQGLARVKKLARSTFTPGCSPRSAASAACSGPSSRA